MSTGTTQKIKSTSSKDTEKLGEQIGQNLRGGEILELKSDLGGGKTTFVRGLALGMGSSDHVASPSFTISRVYKVDQQKLPESSHLDTQLGVDAKRKGNVQNSTLSAHRKSTTTLSSKTGNRVASFVSKQAGGVRELWHFDFHRLDDAGLMKHELAEVLGEQGTVLVIEWADTVRDILPKQRLIIEIKTLGENSRKLELNCPNSLKYLMRGIKNVDFNN